MMLTYSFNEIGSDNLYSYLYKQIRDDILEGNLKTGDKLPSKRSFAHHLSVSTITVENAYNQLMVEGYIYSKAKRGYFVADIKATTMDPPKVKPGDYSRWDRKTYELDFTSNQVSSDNYPFNTWTKLFREVIAQKKKELMTNSPGGGVLELRRAIANHLNDFRGIQVLPEQIIVGAGTEYLYGILIQLLGYVSPKKCFHR